MVKLCGSQLREWCVMHSACGCIFYLCAMSRDAEHCRHQHNVSKRDLNALRRRFCLSHWALDADYECLQVHCPATHTGLLGSEGVKSIVLTRLWVVQMPWATVFKVDHCGFTVSWRQVDEEGAWDWKVEEQQEGRGVAWTC